MTTSVFNPQTIQFTPLSRDQFLEALPAKMKKVVNQKLIDSINNTLGSQEEMDQFRENLLSFGDILKEGKFKLTSYISAVKYVSHKLLGDTNKDAYIKTFSDKYQRFQIEGILDKVISSYIAAFHKSKLVMLIFEQTLIPTHVLNAPLLQSAINVQAHLMVSAKSEKVRSDAASCLIMHLKPPEIKKFELDIGVADNDAIEQLKQTTRELARKQKELIKNGAMTAGDIATKPLELAGSSK